jgi:hypothetical protein
MKNQTVNTRFVRIPIVIHLCCILIGTALAAEPIEFKLAWDANLEADLDGYEIYFKEAGSSEYKLIGDIYMDELADPENPMVTITDLYSGIAVDPANPTFSMDQLKDNSQYYFALTAFDQEGNVSDFSEEICVEVSGASVFECQSDSSESDTSGGGGGGGQCFIAGAACGSRGAYRSIEMLIFLGFVLIVITLQRNIYVIKFCQFDSFFSVRLVGGQIAVKVILNNFHRPRDAQGSEGKY